MDRRVGLAFPDGLAWSFGALGAQETTLVGFLGALLRLVLRMSRHARAWFALGHYGCNGLEKMWAFARQLGIPQTHGNLGRHSLGVGVRIIPAASPQSFLDLRICLSLD